MNNVEFKFLMKPYDFENVRYEIGPFEENDDKLYEVIEEIEFGPFGSRNYDLCYNDENNTVVLVIPGRICYEEEDIITNILDKKCKTICK